MTASSDAKNGPRPWWHLLVCGPLLGAALALTLLQHGTTELTHPIEIWVDTDAPESPILAATVHAERVVEVARLEQHWQTGPHEGFRSAQLPYTGIVLIGSPATLARFTRVTLRMSTHILVFDQGQFQTAWVRWDGQLPDDAPPGSEGRVFQAPLSERGSYFAILNNTINFEGDAALAHYVFLSPIFVVFSICFVSLLVLRFFFGNRPELIDDGNVPAAVEKHTSLWLLAGLVVLVVAGVLLEQRNPYYFTQDDNFAQFLPNILYGCDSLSAGVFPSWNPHQYLGAPLAEIGTYALTYPGTYLSYWLAVFVLNDRYATLEVFCCLHLLVGYVVLFWLGRRSGLAAPLASAFSLCQVLSGFALVAGRSWYYMTPVYVWAPLLFIAVLHLRAHAPTLRWTLGTGLVIGLFFHAGNAQMWVYGVGLAGLMVLWSCLNQSMPWTRILQMIPAGLIGLGVAAVLLVPQYQATRELHRHGGEGWDIGVGLLSVFAPSPTPLIVDPTNPRPGAPPEFFGTVYHAGSVFTIAWLAVALLGVTRRGTVRGLLRDPWLALALLTFLLIMGRLGVLWTWQAMLPVIDQFNHPVKFLPFFHLFSCVIGAGCINRVIQGSSWPRSWQAVTFIVVSSLLLYHAFCSRSALFLYADEPYPVLPGELADLRRNDGQSARILPLALNRSPSSDYVVGLHHHFPTVYGISSIGGYDPLIEQDARYALVLKELRDDLRSATRKHGVTHLVLHREVAAAFKKRDWAADEWRKLPRSYWALVADCEHLTPVMHTQTVHVFAINGTTPIAFPMSKASHALPVRLAPSSVNVDVSNLTTDQEVGLNYLWRPGIRVYADGELAPARANDDQHIAVPVRAGTHHLEVRYESPWFAGFLLGSVLVVAGLLGWIGMKDRFALSPRGAGDAPQLA